ncbi:MAG: DMT family transporter [Phyllobacteriaceae bacterium]|nr:DMT family transporter [Phyllobacteriaceae bacterium]
MTRLQANMLLLLTGAIWGMGFVAQSTAMAAIGPFLFIGLRFGVATVAILPLALREARVSGRALSLRDWRVFAGIGAILFGGMAAQQAGLMTTSVTNSGFLTGLYLIFVPFLGVALFRDFPHWVVWPSAFAALGGVFLLSGGRLDGLKTGDWLTILCAGFWALQILFITRYANHTGRPVTLAVTQFAVTAVLALAVALPFERIDFSAIRLAVPEILFAGVFAGGIAFTMQTVGQRHTTAANAAIILSSEALFAALFGALMLGDRLNGMAALGCALIFAAMLAVELIPLALKRRALTP